MATPEACARQNIDIQLTGRGCVVQDGLAMNQLTRSDLDEFVACYHPHNRHDRRPTWSPENPDVRWRSFTYDELISRDKVNLDIFWLRDETLEDSANLPDPDVLAREIVEQLEAALEQGVEDFVEPVHGVMRQPGSHRLPSPVGDFVGIDIHHQRQRMSYPNYTIVCYWRSATLRPIPPLNVLNV